MSDTASPAPEGLYEITLSGTDRHLALINGHPNSPIVLVAPGTEHAAQIWEVRRTDFGTDVTLRNIRHNIYASFHAAQSGQPLVARAEPRGWTAQKLANSLKNEYHLKVLSKPFHVEANADALPATLHAGPATVELYPQQTELHIEGFANPPQWTFHRIFLASEAQDA